MNRRIIRCIAAAALVVLMLAASFTLFSCGEGGGKKSPKDELVGTWVGDSGTWKFTFTSDGQLTQTSQKDETNSTTVEYSINGDNTMTIKQGAGIQTLIYTSDAKNKGEEGWYIESGVLYFRGTSYTKQ